MIETLGISLFMHQERLARRLLTQRLEFLNTYLRESGIERLREGYSGQILEQSLFLAKQARRPGIRRIMEIGFHAGHSSMAFLSAQGRASVTSFDLGEHRYTPIGKRCIDERFPGRHRLILGDSRHTVPELHASEPNARFDLIFLDGCHEYEFAKADLENSRQLAHPDTILIFDDVVVREDWQEDYNEGPNRAWKELKASGVVLEHGQVDCRVGRGYAWGRYA